VKKGFIETFVGLFMLAGIAALLVLALKVSGLSSSIGKQGYDINASFDNVGDLKIHAPVTVAGVKVGQVTNIQLDPVTFKALVTMQIEPNKNTLPVDTSASILTQGLLGANYISLTPGFDQTVFKNGDRITSTHSALVLEDLIGQLVFSLKNSGSK
jgi:phospholipid/cholesterol/gamma-HCH transport system substrate-binding protein